MSRLPCSRWSRKARISSEGPNPKGSGAEAWSLGMMVSISGSPCSLHLPAPSPGQTMSSVFNYLRSIYSPRVRSFQGFVPEDQDREARGKGADEPADHHVGPTAL